MGNFDFDFFTSDAQDALDKQKELENGEAAELAAMDAELGITSEDYDELQAEQVVEEGARPEASVFDSHPLAQDDELEKHRGELYESDEEKKALQNELNKHYEGEKASMAELGLDDWAADKLGKIREAAKSTDSEDFQVPGLAPVAKVGDIAIGTLLDTAQDVGNALIDVADWTDGYLQEKGLTEHDFIKDVDLEFADKYWPSQSTGESVLRGVLGYVVPFGAAYKTFNAGSKLARLGKAQAFSSALEFVKADKDEGNLSNLIQQAPMLSNPLTALLAIDDNDDDMDARIKGALEAVVVDTVTLGGASVAEMLYKTVKTARAARKLSKAKPRVLKTTPEGQAALKEARERPAVETLEDGTMSMSLSALDDGDVLGSIEGILKGTGVEDFKFKTQDIDSRIVDATNKQIADPKLGAEALEMVKKGEVLTFERSQQLENLKVAGTRDLVKLAKMARVTGDEAAKGEVLNGMSKLQLVVSAADKNASEQGAALLFNQGRVKIPTHKKERYIAEMVERNFGKLDSDEMLDMIIEMDGMSDAELGEAAGRVFKLSNGKKFMNALFAVRVNGLVSSVKTQSMNLANGVVRIGVEGAERGTAAIVMRKVIPHGLPIKKGVKSKALTEKVFFGEGTAFMKGATERATIELQAGIAGMLNNYKLGRAALDQMPKLKAAREIAIEGSIMQTKAGDKSLFGILEANNISDNALSAEAFGYTGMGGKAMDVVGKVIGLPTKFLGRVDKSMGAMHYAGEMHALGTRVGLNQGLQGDDLAKFIDDFAKKPPTEINPDFQAIHKQAQKQAVETSNVNRFLNKLDGEGWQATEKLIKGNELGRVLMPFARIDLNILAQSMERVPFLAKYMPRYKQIMASGNPAEIAKAEARVAFGGMVMATTGALAFNGHITGDGPKNFEQRKKLIATGWHPNSIRFGGHYYDISRLLEPFARMINFSANMAEIAGYMNDSSANPNLKKDYAELVGLSAVYLGEAFTPEFLTSNMADLMDVLASGDEKTTAKAGGRIVDNLIVGQIPYSSMLRDARKYMDPARRETTGPEIDWLQERVNRLKSAMPGFSKDLPPTRNMFGEIVNYPTGFGPDFASPIIRTEYKSDPVYDEIVRLGISGPLKNPEPMPGEKEMTLRMPPRQIRKTLPGTDVPIVVDLNPRQYDELVQIMGNEEGSLGPQSLKDAMSFEVENDYPSLGLAPKNDSNKRVILNAIYAKYKKNAMKMLQLQEPELLENMRDGALDVMDRSMYIPDEEE